VFRIAGGDEAMEKEFTKQAETAGLVGTPGHRSVGGMRISLYNAVELERLKPHELYERVSAQTRLSASFRFLLLKFSRMASVFLIAVDADKTQSMRFR